MWKEIILVRNLKKKNMSKFVAKTVPVDGLAPFG